MIYLLLILLGLIYFSGVLVNVYIGIYFPWLLLSWVIPVYLKRLEGK